MEYSSVGAIRRDIDKGAVLPIYLLQGDEPFFIDEVTDLIENQLLTDAEKSFNLSILYGREIDAKQVLDHARQFPMMSERRIVLLKEAQFMRDLKSLETYFKRPSESTVLAIAHKKKIDGRVKWVKDAKKSDRVGFFTSNRIPEYRIFDWVQQYAGSENLSLTNEAIAVLCQYLGTNLKKITNEIQKLKISNPDQMIGPETVKKFIGISRDFDVFALLKAISNGDVAKTHMITGNLEQHGKEHPLQKILPGMASYFEKVFVVAQHFRKDDAQLARMIGTYPNFVKEYRQMARRYGVENLSIAYSRITEADAMSKGLNRKNPQGILRELVAHILQLQVTAN